MPPPVFNNMPRNTPLKIPDRNSATRILLVRLGAIGDVIMTTPIPPALRETFPNAHIAWLVEPLSVPFVRAVSAVDEVILFEHKKDWMALLKAGKWGKLRQEVRAFGDTLRARNFDIAIDLQGLFKSGFLTKLSGAPIRIGVDDAGEGNRFFMTHQAHRPQRTTRITQANVAVLEILGIPTIPRRPVVEISPADRAEAQAALAECGLANEPYIACVTTSSLPQKEWIWPRWGELADLLHARTGLRTVFVGGPERRIDSLRLIEGRASRPATVVGRLPLLQSAAVVQGAALVIGVDTGITYTALATDTPTVALYGCTDPSWLAEEPFVTVAYHPYPCSPCMRRPTCKLFDCIHSVTVEEVADLAVRQLERFRACPAN